MILGNTSPRLSRHYLQFCAVTLELIPHSQDVSHLHISPMYIEKKINNLKRTCTCPSDINTIIIIIYFLPNYKRKKVIKEITKEEK